MEYFELPVKYEKSGSEQKILKTKITVDIQEQNFLETARKTKKPKVKNQIKCK